MHIPRHHIRERPSINITPLVDLMFNLIIFFLVSAQFHEEERDIQVNLPQTHIEETLSSTARSLLILNVRRDGTYIVGGNEVSPDELRALLSRAVKVNPDQKVLVRADKQALHGYVAAAVAVCKECGIRQANIGYELPR
ncbi:MAG: biopolymer transporter ExbD [Candidatus Sumerlaeia bacterium]|nr:biopolymer transporter ExbD [Candidatus Sumerlaeia bacterium]